MASLVKVSATVFLFKWLLGLTLLFVSVIRINAVSGVYLLCLLALPLIASPTTAVHLRGAPGKFIKTVVILSALGCVTQVLYQVVLAGLGTYDEPLESCNFSSSLWRQLGYQRLDVLDALNVARLVVPDVGLLFVSIVVFVACKYIITPPQTEGDENGESLSPVMERRPLRTSVVVEGLRSCNVMMFCALAGIIFPSAISSVYLLGFLIVVTWWSFYQTWGRVFKWIEIVWLVYSGCHVILLYLAQFQFFQEAVPLEVDDDTKLDIIDFVGLTPFVDSLRCDIGKDPRQLVFDTNVPWTTFVNPAIVFLFYWFVAHEVHRWISGPEYVEVIRRASSTKRIKKPKNEEKQRLVSEAGPSYQTMGATTQQQLPPESGPEALTHGGDATGAESCPTSGDEGSHRTGPKMSVFTTFICFLTKQSYIAGLILMMAWSIIYLSWMTFVLLLWALLIWIIPISSTRNRCLYTSPLLVFYAEAIIISTFIYGMKTNLPETVKGVNLNEVGLIRYEYPFLPLLAQLAFTVMFWLTLRQFLREQRLRKHNVDEGIVLQPFGVIFSGPHEEVTSLEVRNAGLPSRSHSVTMTFLGTTTTSILGKYWILLCGLMFFIIGLQGAVDIFKIVYMILFLLLLNIFLVSFTVFRVILRVFGWIVVLYSISVLCMIYTYQFKDIRFHWTNGTGLSTVELQVMGLQEFTNISELLVNLLIPTAFIILVMIQLHYFHNHFLNISKITSSGYRPSHLDDDKVNEKPDEVQQSGEQAVGETHIKIDDTDRESQSSKKSVPRTRSTFKLRLMKAYQYFRNYLDPLQVVLWRLLEVHMIKVIFFTIIMVITVEVSAVNGILLLIIFIPIALPLLHRICCIISMIWVSLVLLGKMVFQLDFTVWFPDETLLANCTENKDFPNLTNPNFYISEWFGFVKVSNFYHYVQGYVAVIIMLVIHSIVSLRQQQYRHQRGLVKPSYSVVFDDVTRELADRGLLQCLKFLCNFCFYKFGLEICFTTTVIVAAVRHDFISFLYLTMIVPLLFIRRRTCANLWPFYVLTLTFMFPVVYALVLGLPPVFCISYPWYDKLPERLVSWFYLSDYDKPPDPSVIVADFFQLLFACLQWHVFRSEGAVDITRGGGNNYEASVDVENVHKNPVPNFTFNRSYLDVIKSIVFGYAFYITLAIVFLCATTRISILGLVYLVFTFFFLWYGPKFLSKPTHKLIKQWNLLIGYNLCVIFLKVVLQIMACTYAGDLKDKDLCWVMQLFGVVCLQYDYVPSDNECTLPTGEARLTWDVVCFFFVVFQRRIFTSNYFLYIVIDLEEEERLASKGAELINEILATKVRNKKLEEKRILEGVKRKMKRIKEKQAKLISKNENWQPNSHAEAIRGTGGYYMFEDIDEDELSDLEAEGIVSTEEPGPKNPLQLAFHGIVEDPKRAMEIDREHQAGLADAEENEDAVSYSTAISGEGADAQAVKDHKHSLEEAQDDDGDEAAVCGSDQDDIEMETEESEGRIKNALMLTWLIFLRSLDTLVRFLDSISEEYRYVARELRKLTTEGKRKRALRKQRKSAEMQDLSGKERGDRDAPKDEGDRDAPKNEGAVEGKEDAATGTTADESTQLREVKVTILTPPSTQKAAERYFMSNDDTISLTETNSSEQFQRAMPRPIRLLYATIYAVIAQSQLVCYFIIILNQLVSASLLSLPLPLMVFLWAMLSVPRPTKRFWITVITYTEAVVLIKYLFQFQFYSWNKEEKQNAHLSDPLWWPRVLGIQQRPRYAAIDLCILLAVFFHRSVLIRHGLWQESRVVPNLEEHGPVEAQGEVSSDVSIEDDRDGDDTDRGKKEQKKKRRKKRKERKAIKGAEGGAQAEELLSSGDEQVAEFQSSLKSAEESLSELEESPKWYQPAINFYHNMIDPMYSAVTDVYVFIFGIQFILFLIIVFFSYAFGEEQATNDVAQLISSNTIPISFLLLLLVMFVLIVIDRAIYLCKDVTAKFIFLVVLVITVHIWLFFVLPYYNNKQFVQNTPAQVWYFFICLYFGLSAYQITSGYPTRILGNFLCRRYNLVSVILFYGWRVIPFLTELRTLMDWIWTDTTLSLSHWLQVEDIYANVYPIKCFRNREVAYPVPRGTKMAWLFKYGVGGGMLLLLILIIWFPLILISLANTTSVKNPPTSATVQVGFEGFEPIFKMSALTEDLIPYGQSEYGSLEKKFGTDINALSFLNAYRPEDIVVATFSGNSTGTWDVSPPSRQNLIKTLINKSDLTLTFTYSFTRITNNAQVTPTVENTYQLTLNSSQPGLRENLAEQLNGNTVVPGIVKYLIPTYIKVSALSSPEPATPLIPDPKDYSDASLLLQDGKIPNISGSREWWEVRNASQTNIELITFNERVALELLAPLSSYGIIGLYVSLVLVIGRFVRMFFSGVSYQIMFNELPNVDRILKLCLDIYLVRESGEMEMEEDLTAKLIFLYRSPETLIKVTKWKTD